MARIRTIKPEFWGDPKTARVSRDARLLFLGMLNESDDEGRQLGSPRRVAGAVFPNDEDVTAKMIVRWLVELERERFIVRYTVADVAYVLIPGFMSHQRVAHPSPSKLPSPSRGSRESLANGSGESHETFAPDLGSGSRNGSRKDAVSGSDEKLCPRCQGRGKFFHAGSGHEMACPCVNPTAVKVEL